MANQHGTIRFHKKKEGDSTDSNKHSGEGITLVNLDDYEFSPPGPMGWTAAEYERMIEELKK